VIANSPTSARQFRRLLITLPVTMLLLVIHPAAAITAIRIVNQPIVANQEGWIEVQNDNPVDVGGVGMGILYDPTILTIVDPKGTPDENTEEVGSVIPGETHPTLYNDLFLPDPPGRKRIAFGILGPTGTDNSGCLFRFKYRAASNARAGATTFANNSGYYNAKGEYRNNSVRHKDQNANLCGGCFP
jgi:hypothetical protein